MKIGINASFARKENTGIGQVTLNFLKKLGELKVQGKNPKDFEFVVYLEEDIKLKLPKNFTKKIFKPLWRRDDLIRKIWWEKFSLPRRVKKDRCDVFLSLYQSATVFARSETTKQSRSVFHKMRLPRFARNDKDIRHIMLVHDIIPYLFPEYLNNARKEKYYSLTRRAVSRADKVITISRRSEKDLIQHWHLDPARITVAPIDVDEIYKKRVSQEQSVKVMKKYQLKPGYIYNTGGLETRKNVETLIYAYRSLLESNRQSHWLENFPQLVIAGKLMPELSPLILDAEKLVNQLNLNNQVKLLDFVPQKEMPALYHNASLFVYPSLYEGFGLPILEAMNQGVPVIASRRSSLPEVGLDGALYFDPRNEKDLAMVMRNALLNKNLRDTLKTRGKARARHFSWDIFLKKILNIARAMEKE